MAATRADNDTHRCFLGGQKDMQLRLGNITQPNDCFAARAPLAGLALISFGTVDIGSLTGHGSRPEWKNRCWFHARLYSTVGELSCVGISPDTFRMSELEDTVAEVVEKHPSSRFDSAIALLVAIAATFMAVCNIKDGNIVQAMAQAQSRSVSKWSQYQSKSTKQNLAESTVASLEVVAITAPVTARPEIQKRLAFEKGEVARYEKEKSEIKDEAEGLEKEYDRLNIHDDQFDMAEASLSVALALFGVSALTRKRELFIFALVLAAIGVSLGLSGFLGWAFHPEWLAKLLG